MIEITHPDRPLDSNEIAIIHAEVTRLVGSFLKPLDSNATQHKFELNEMYSGRLLELEETEIIQKQVCRLIDGFLEGPSSSASDLKVFVWQLNRSNGFTGSFESVRQSGLEKRITLT